MLHTKLHIPQVVNRNLVARPELTEWLNEGLERKLTTITAPAGFGKTMSLTVWAQKCNCKLAWVSLDRHDNERKLMPKLLAGWKRTGSQK